MKLNLIVFTVCCISLSFAANDDGKCEPGHQYQEDCNTCTCTETGIYSCTRRACYNGPQFPDTEPIREKICEPGAVKKEDCNSCHCSADGTLWACTRKFCRPKENSERRRRDIDESENSKVKYKSRFTEAETRAPGFKCQPNSSVLVECNTCRCDENGDLSICTLMGCISGWWNNYTNPFEESERSNQIRKREVDLERKGSILNPYTEAETKQPNFRCEPDSSLKVDCKRCSCAKDGKSVDFCIETTCYKRGSTGSTRSPEDYAKLSNKGGLLNPYTEAETKSPSFKCTPDSSVKVDCKRCLCGDDGKTLTFCIDVSCYKVPNQSNVDSTAATQTATQTAKSSRKSRNVANCESFEIDLTCPKGSKAHPYLRKEVAGKEAETCQSHGKQSFNVECNRCLCSVTGQMACTLVGCDSKRYETLRDEAHHKV